VSPIDANTLDARIERAVSHVLDDERWRSTLTDDEAKPLLHWAIGRAEAIARETSDIADGEAAGEIIRSGTARLRNDLDLLAHAIGAFRDGSLERFTRLVDEASTQLSSARLRSMSDDWIARRPHLESAQLASEIADALAVSS
jgi:dGTP triphosphohydrolase